MRSKLPSALRALIPIAAGVAVVTSAHATYTVVEPDLYPTAALEARQFPAEAPVAEKFRVGYPKNSSQLGPLARTTIDSLLSRMQNAAHIKLVGHVDSANATGEEKQRMLAIARASSLRSYLTGAGVPADIIEIDSDIGPNPLASQGVAAADIYVTQRPDPRTSVVAQARAQIPPSTTLAPVASATAVVYGNVPAPEAPAIPHPYRYLNHTVDSMPAPSGTFGHPSSDQQVVEYINLAVQNGQLSPVVALQLLRGMVESGADVNAAHVMRQLSVSAAAYPVPAAPQPLPQPLPQPAAAPIAAVATAVSLQRPAPAPVPAPFVAAPAHVEQWILDSRMTLKDNLDDWARTAGWNAPVWLANNYYQVTRSVVLNGSFTDALKIVTDNTGLNICAIAVDKRVRVTDPNVPCTK